MEKKLILIDGSSYLYRAFYALPPLTSPSGIPTGAVYGFVRIVSKLLKEYSPEYIAVVFDLPSKTFRHETYTEYKANRRETPDQLKVQIPIIKEILKLWGIKILEMEGYEADDIIATVSKMAKENGFNVLIITPDKDMTQLIDSQINILNPITNEVINTEKVEEKYGIKPSQFVDFLAIVGDSVDNIKGVKGVGEKTAKKLLNQYGSIEGIYQNIESLKPKLKEAFLEAKDRLEENRFLVKLKDDIPLDFTLEDLKKEKADLLKLKEKFEQLNFKTLLKEIQKENRPKPEEKGKQISLF
ncbi:MAG: 5'-3' exonuclease [Aquificae bacterium]|nr:5'-3' exonuclease [Aquificota bacterium]